MKKIIIATRGSQLALWQADYIKDRLEAEHSGDITVELNVITTTGDKILDAPLAKIGGKGLFLKEIEEALLAGEADIAVHSMKDVPPSLPEGLKLGVIPEREDPTDQLLSVQYDDLNALPQGAKVGTSSLRRQAQLLTLRPDLDVQTLRGNVNTRRRKLLDGEYDAIVMATAAIKRIGIDAPKMSPLAPPSFLPAVGQGALGIEYAENRNDLEELLDFLNHPETFWCVSAERGFMDGIEGSCQTPVAAFARMTSQNTLEMEGLVADLAGKQVIRRKVSGDIQDGAQLGRKLAHEILDAGGRELLDAIITEES